MVTGLKTIALAIAGAMILKNVTSGVSKRPFLKHWDIKSYQNVGTRYVPYSYDYLEVLKQQEYDRRNRETDVIADTGASEPTGKQSPPVFNPI